MEASRGARRGCEREYSVEVSPRTRLRYGGVLEAIRVARAGYAVRLPHSQFVQRYRALAAVDAAVVACARAAAPPGDGAAATPSDIARRAAAAVLAAAAGFATDAGAVLGRTKVFLRQDAYADAERNSRPLGRIRLAPRGGVVATLAPSDDPARVRRDDARFG